MLGTEKMTGTVVIFLISSSHGHPPKDRCEWGKGCAHELSPGILEEAKLSK